jgi:hypothetical protein
MATLPPAIKTDELFLKIRSAALTWHNEHNSYFEVLHKKNLEQGKYGTKAEIVSSLFSALQYSVGIGKKWCLQHGPIDELQRVQDYLAHISALDESRGKDADTLISELRSRIKWRPQ